MPAGGAPYGAAVPGEDPGPDGRKEGLTKEHIGTARKAPRSLCMIRNSFTMPESESARLEKIEKTGEGRVQSPKSELLRIGVALISEMDVMALKGHLAALPRKADHPTSQ